MINCTAIISTVINNLTNVSDVVGILSAPVYELLFPINFFFFFTFLSKTEASAGTEHGTLSEYQLSAVLPDLTPGIPTQCAHYFSATSCVLQRYHALRTKR